MDWYNPLLHKRSSVSAGMPPIPSAFDSIALKSLQLQKKQQNTLLPPSTQRNNINATTTDAMDALSYFLSKNPLYAVDWMYSPYANSDCIAIGSYKESTSNSLQIVHGVAYGREASQAFEENCEDGMHLGGSPERGDQEIEGFDFHKVAEIGVDYPVTNIQWDPTILGDVGGFQELFAASLDVLRLYKVDHDTLDSNNNYKLNQLCALANCASTATNKDYSATSSEAVNTLPPITSFDWNKVDTNTIITSSVDTTCTVWDLNRAGQLCGPGSDIAANSSHSEAASIKAQLIAHDSEVFDVKFLHNSTNVFVSVGKDGSMRLFDLRSLEHSTIIYEPPQGQMSSGYLSPLQEKLFGSKALLKLSTSNIDQYYMATIAASSSEVLIIDSRMPGVPIANLDASSGGSQGAVNSITWHPRSNYLLTGGDDCEALVWDCNNLSAEGQKEGVSSTLAASVKPEARLSGFYAPILCYDDDIEINNVCWRSQGDWFGVISGKKLQAVLI